MHLLRKYYFITYVAALLFSFNSSCCTIIHLTFIIMNKTINLKRLIIYTVIIVGLFLSYRYVLNTFRKEIHRLQNNLANFMNDSDSKIYQLTKKELKEIQKQQNDSLLTMIMDSVGIKFRHIERTINHKYTYTYDTTKTILVKYENQPDWYFNKALDSCLSISGRVSYPDSTIYFDKVTIDYRARTVYYWQRKRKILGIPFGRKMHFAKTENKCSGETTVEEIEIIKK